MYIIGLNRTSSFYFISREEERKKLEAKGIEVLQDSFDRLSSAANYVKELNGKNSRDRLNILI